MNLRRPLLGVAILSTGYAFAAPSILVPSITSVANENAFDNRTFIYVLNNSGLNTPVNAGDSLATAQAAVHTYGNYTESWVTQASTTDYFLTGLGATSPPSAVFDLGADTVLSNIILWQYQNDGGGANNVGNHTRTLDLRFNTDAQGPTTFSGSASLITMLPVTDGDGLGNGNDMNGVNGAQSFALSATARYVQVTFTDNYRNFQGITGGGDRAGLGELRFFGEAVPEPGSTALALLAGGLAMRRRRSA